MKFTDIFIRRPVLATVVSLMILVLGLRAYGVLPILQYPRTENAIVTVTTIYYGADPDVVSGFITTPLENAIAQANGIDYMNSVSQSGVSTISIYLRLNYDADKALTEINTKVSSVLSQLPTGSQQPILTVKVGQTIDAMYIGFNSDVLASNQITDYLVRVVQPKLQAVPGVQTAELLGSKVFALRAWLDPQKLAAFGLTSTDVSQALAANDYISGVGNTKGQMVQVNLTASTGLHSAEEFRNLVIKESNGAAIRLKDIATVTLGSEDYESEVGFDGKRAVYIGIQVAPAANLLDVIGGVRKVFPDIQTPAAERAQRRDHLRFHRVREQLDQRGDPQPERGAGDRHRGGVPVPGLAALGRHPDRRDPAVAGRHLHHHAGARLFDQPLDPARPGAGHRPGGGRRHHRGRERQPASRGRHDAHGCSDPGGARARRPDHRHDGRAGRRLCADRLPGRPDRRAVRRVRADAGGRRHGLRRRGADAVADAVLAAAQAACRRAARLGSAAHRLHRPPLRAIARGL